MGGPRGLGMAWVSTDARVGVGVTKSSKPSPDHSKITTKTKTFHFEDFSFQPTLPSTIDQV